MSEKTIYVCENELCPLGGVGVPGRFTGGIAKEQLTTLTGKPEADMESGEYGAGICPNCGKPGVELDADKQRDQLVAEAERAHRAHIRAIRGGEA
jgi:hypothetical protein